MRHIWWVGSVLLASACAGPVEPREASGSFAALLAGVPQTYVLGMVEDQDTDPIITFDHSCAGIRRQTLVRDTIQLAPDGSARRALYLERLAGGEVVGSSYISAEGTWTNSSETFQSGSRLTLYLSASNSAYSMPLRITGSDRIAIASALGGTCAGSALDGRMAEFVYTNR
jgi:hypothetical protein